MPETAGTIRAACDHAAARFDPDADRWHCPGCGRVWIDQADTLRRVNSLSRKITSLLGSARAELEHPTGDRPAAG